MPTKVTNEMYAKKLRAIIKVASQDVAWAQVRIGSNLGPTTAENRTFRSN